MIQEKKIFFVDDTREKKFIKIKRKISDTKTALFLTVIKGGPCRVYGHLWQR